MIQNSASCLIRLTKEKASKMVHSMMKSSFRRPEYSFDWSNYLRGLGKAILIIGCVITIIMIFTVVFIKDSSRVYSDPEFNLMGFITTVAVLLGTMFAHAMCYWREDRLQQERRK